MLAVAECAPNVTEISAQWAEHIERDFQELPLASNSGEYIASAGYPRDSRAQLSTPSTKLNVEAAMLAKCANPVCCATFRYFHEGRLFVFESKPDSPKRGPPADPEHTGRSRSPQYFWLCSSCCSALTVQSDGDQGVTVVRKQGVPQNVFVMEERTRMAA